MKKILIHGGNELSGKIKIGGAKNSVVALIPASLLATGKCKISNVPNITDRDALFDIVKLLNNEISMKDDIVEVDSTNLTNTFIDEKHSIKLRASYYFMGVLLAKFRHAEVCFPGGCNIGARPIDLHLTGFEALGATVTHDEETHKYTLDAPNLHGADINLSFASVGATINIMFAATMAEGVTTIRNAAKEVEIINIADYLNKMGAKITGAGTEVITIEGVKEMHSAEIEVVPDRIEAGTYMILGALIGKDLEIAGVNHDHIQSLLDKFDEMGVDYKIGDNSVFISKSDSIKACDVRTDIYPGFPTDIGQPFSVLLAKANGVSHFEETIWENRTAHISYLNKMGANIEMEDNCHFTITGVEELHGEEIDAMDLRGGASLVLAGLVAKGTTKISNIDYILRGYEKLIYKLKAVGADIKIIKDAE